MSSSYMSGNTNVNGTVTTVGTFTPQSIQVSSAHGTRCGSAGTTTVLTVPANHEYDIIGYSWALHSDVSGSHYGSISIGSAVISGNSYGATAGNVGHSGSMALPNGCFIKLSAGSTVTIAISAGNYGSVDVTVHYIDKTV